MFITNVNLKQYAPVLSYMFKFTTKYKAMLQTNQKMLAFQFSPIKF